MKNGASFPKNWWAELTMLSKITGTLVSKRELTQCSTQLTNILREKRSKRYLKWPNHKPILLTSLKTKKARKKKMKTQSTNWPRIKRRNSPTTWRESNLNICKRYSSKSIFRTLNISKILHANTLFSCNYFSKIVAIKMASQIKILTANKMHSLKRKT